MTVHTTTAAPAFKNAFVDAATTLFANPAVYGTQEVLVVFGRPLTYPADLIWFGAIRSVQEPAGLGSLRPREEVHELDVTISVHRGGKDPATERLCSDRAYELLGILEYYVRITDTQLGGAVRYCFLSTHNSAGMTDVELLKDGRTIEIDATFRATARVSN